MGRNIEGKVNPDQKLKDDIWKLVKKHAKNPHGQIMSSIRFKLVEHVGKKGPVYEVTGVTTTWKHPKKKANQKAR